MDIVNARTHPKDTDVAILSKTLCKELHLRDAGDNTITLELKRRGLHGYSGTTNIGQSYIVIGIPSSLHSITQTLEDVLRHELKHIKDWRAHHVLDISNCG